MPAQRITGFQGAIPKLDPRDIPDSAGQDATNVFLTSGRLDPMLQPNIIATTRSTGVQTIYRLFNGATAYWLNWNEQVDIAESPVYVVNNSRIAFSSPSFEPRQTDLTLAGSASPYPGQWYVLGVTPPITAPAFTSVTGGSGTTESRSYVYTFVTQWGEESAPSPAMAISTGYINGTWNITLPDVAPSNSYTITAASYSSGTVTLTLSSTFGLRKYETITITGVVGMTDLNNNSYQVQSVNTATNQITITQTTLQTYTSGGSAARNAPHNTTNMLKRVYRTVTSSTGTNYYQVGSDIAVATTTFADSFTVIGGQLVTIGWVMPPANLQGLVTHPSGALVGFVGNQIYMSIPYSIYAWPLSQSNTLDYTVVGLGVFSQTIVACTEGRPYALTFTDPAAASAQKLDNNWPCLSKRGIVTFNNGVYFPTTLGLAYIGSSGANLISEQYYSQRDWNALNPSTFVAAHYDNKYYAYYNDGNISKVLVFSNDVGLSYINIQPTAMYTDRKTGEVYIANSGYIQQLNATSGLFVPYSWRSKEFVSPNPVNLGACKVDFTGALGTDNSSAIAAANATIKASNATILAAVSGTEGTMNNGAINAYAVDGSNLADLTSSSTSSYYVSVSLYANGVLQFTKQVTDTKVWRFPAGLKYDNYSIGVTGTAPVKAVVLGGTPMDLKAV